MKTVAFLAILSALMFNPAMAQQLDEPIDPAAATRALETLRALVTEQNARSYGFDSQAEAETATLGSPIPVTFVQLDELREYSEGQDPAALLHSVNQVFVPVVIGGQVRSSILMERSDDGWRAVSFGAPNLARLISESRAAAARDTNADMATMSAVQVGALGRYYIASLSEDRLMLTAVTDDPELQIKAGETRLASEVFARLAPIARAYNELPM